MVQKSSPLRTESPNRHNTCIVQHLQWGLTSSKDALYNLSEIIADVLPNLIADKCMWIP